MLFFFFLYLICNFYLFSILYKYSRNTRQEKVWEEESVIESAGYSYKQKTKKNKKTKETKKKKNKKKPTKGRLD